MPGTATATTTIPPPPPGFVPEDQAQSSAIPPPPPGFVPEDQAAQASKPGDFQTAPGAPIRNSNNPQDVKTATAQAQKPGFASTVSDVTLGTKTPLDQAKEELAQLEAHPVDTLLNAGKTAMMAPVHAAYQTFWHPIDTATTLTGGPQFAQGWADKNPREMAGALVGGLLNAAPIAAGAEKAGLVDKAAAATNAISDFFGPTPEKSQRLYERVVAPGSISAEDQGAMRDEFKRAQGPLAEEARGRPTAGGTIRGEVLPEPLAKATGAESSEGATLRVAQRAHAAADRLWNQTVAPAIDTYADVKRPGADVAAKIRSVFTDIDKQTKPGAVHAGDALASMFDRPLTVKEMADDLTELNNDKAVTRFYEMGPLEQSQAEMADPSLRAKVAAVDALRGKLFDTIAEAGGDKVGADFREARKTWGALRGVEDRLRSAKVPTPQPFTSRLANTARSFWRPEYWNNRETLLGTNNPDRLSAKFFNMLGKTDLKAPDALGEAKPVTPPTRMLPGFATGPSGEQIPVGGPTLTTPPTTAESSVRGSEAPASVQRNAITGRGQRVYSGQLAREVLGQTAEGGPILSKETPAPEIKRPPSSAETWLQGKAMSSGAAEANVREVMRLQKIVDDPDTSAMAKALAKDRLKALGVRR